MGRINRWLIRRLDQLPDPEPLPPKLEELRATIERRGSRMVLISILCTGAYMIGSQLLAGQDYRLIILVPIVFVMMLGVSVGVSYHSRMAVRDYARWLRRQPPTPSRVTRMGVPYERRPPVASIECSDCPASSGQRHSRNCPSVPPEWFNRGR